MHDGVQFQALISTELSGAHPQSHREGSEWWAEGGVWRSDLLQTFLQLLGYCGGHISLTFGQLSTSTARLQLCHCQLRDFLWDLEVSLSRRWGCRKWKWGSHSSCGSLGLYLPVTETGLPCMQMKTVLPCSRVYCENKFKWHIKCLL